MSDDYDPYDDDNEYDGPPCPKCDGDRIVPCYCGGDLCVCTNYGERDCPLCFGEGVADPKRAEKYLETEREMTAFMRKWWDEDKAASSDGGVKSPKGDEALLSNGQEPDTQ